MPKGVGPFPNMGMGATPEISPAAFVRFKDADLVSLEYFHLDDSYARLTAAVSKDENDEDERFDFFGKEDVMADEIYPLLGRRRLLL